jgi:DHA2 family multidrug resistance protein
MNQPTYLKPWLGGWSWGSRIALLFILLSAIVEFVVFALSQNYVIAYLGAQPEDVTFSIQICYAGILATLPIQPRLLRWFEMKYYLLGWITFGICLSAACIYTTDLHLFFVIRFCQGAVVCAVAASALTLIPGVIKMEVRQAVVPSIFYGTILSSSVLIAIVTAQVSLDTNFTAVYEYLILFQLIALAIVLVGFNSKSNIRRYPLYQLDWTGSVFLMTAVISMAYFMVYGSKYYWFTDQRIVTAALICLTAAVFYIYRSLTIKRPLLNFSIFTYPKFWIGLALLVLYYGLKESINLVFGYTGGVLQWSPPQVVELGLVNVAGLLIFLVIAALIKIRNIKAMMGFLITGFTLSLIYHLWMYNIFTPDLAFNDLLGPMFLQGAASGLLFVPIMIFIIGSVPPATGISSLAVAAVFRFASLLNAGAGFYTLNLYYSQLYKESFLGHITGTEGNTTERLNGFKQLFLSKGFDPEQAGAMANASLSKALGLQVQLLSNRATFLFIAEITAVILSITIVLYLFQKFYTRSEPAVIAIPANPSL